MKPDYVEGWKAARAQYQQTGSVQPYPPGFNPTGSETEVVLNVQNVVHKTKLREDQIPAEQKTPASAKRRKANG